MLAELTLASSFTTIFALVGSLSCERCFHQFRRQLVKVADAGVFEFNGRIGQQPMGE